MTKVNVEKNYSRWIIFIEIFTKDPNFEENVLPIFVNDLIYHCNNALRNGKNSGFITFKDDESLTIRELTARYNIAKYPYIDIYGVRFSMMMTFVDCDKIMEIVESTDLKDNYEPTFVSKMVSC